MPVQRNALHHTWWLAPRAQTTDALHMSDRGPEATSKQRHSLTSYQFHIGWPICTLRLGGFCNSERKSCRFLLRRIFADRPRHHRPNVFSLHFTTCEPTVDGH